MRNSMPFLSQEWNMSQTFIFSLFVLNLVEYHYGFFFICVSFNVISSTSRFIFYICFCFDNRYRSRITRFSKKFSLTIQHLWTHTTGQPLVSSWWKPNGELITEWHSLLYIILIKWLIRNCTFRSLIFRVDIDVCV